MLIKYNTVMSVVNCHSEIRLNVFNKREKRVNAPVRMRIKRVFDEDGALNVTERLQRSIDNSVRRAKRAVVDFALVNDFDYFGTLTLSDELVGDLIHNPVEMTQKLLKALNNYKDRYNPELRYVLIPEFGDKYGRLHFHVILGGIDRKELFINEHHHLDWKYFRKRFGFVNLQRIKGTSLDRARVAKYCSKYVTKSTVKICNHRYFCSRNLKRPKRTEFDDFSVTIKQWLDLNGLAPYAEGKYWECYSMPRRIAEDLARYIMHCPFCVGIKGFVRAILPPKPKKRAVFTPLDIDFNPFEEFVQCQIAR